MSVKDYWRMFSLPETCYRLGSVLKRKGVKWGLTAGAAVAVIGLGADAILKKYTNVNLPIATANAALIPTAAAIVAFSAGQGLTGLSNWFSSEKLKAADAQLLRQLEDEKKSRMDSHIGILWDRIFAEESRLQYESNRIDWKKIRKQELQTLRKSRKDLIDHINSAGSELKEVLKTNSGNQIKAAKYLEAFEPFSEDMETTKRGFRTSAKYALTHSLHQAIEKNKIGFDLSIIEAFYNGAPFTDDDNILNTFISHNDALRNARKKAKRPLSSVLKEAIFGNPDPKWYTRSMRKTGIMAGTKMDKLNRKHVARINPSYFHAQHVLWRLPEVDKIILKDFGEKGSEVLEDLNEATKSIIRNTFSDNKKTAHNQIGWMYAPDYKHSLDLILDYDVERACNEKHDIIKDIQELNKTLMCEVYSVKKAKKKIKKAGENIVKVDNFLKEHMPEIYNNPLKRRAARTGYHLNRFDLQELIKMDEIKNHENINYQMSLDKIHGELLDIFNNRITAAEKRYTRRINRCRQVYELARIQLLDYVQRVDNLAGYDKTEKVVVESKG